MNIPKSFWLYLILLFLALGAMFILKHYSSLPKEEDKTEYITRDLPEIREEGTMRILAPYALVTASTKHQKLHNTPQDIINTIARKSGLEVKLMLEDNVQKAISRLNVGEVDLLLLPIERTSMLDTTRLLWVRPWVSKPVYLVQRKDSSRLVTRHLQLEDQTITIPKGSPQRLYIEHLSEEIGVPIYVQEDSLYNSEQLIMKVVARKATYTLCSGEEVDKYQTLYPSLDFSLPITYALRRGWVVRQTSPILSDSLTKWFD